MHSPARWLPLTRFSDSVTWGHQCSLPPCAWLIGSALLPLLAKHLAELRVLAPSICAHCEPGMLRCWVRSSEWYNFSVHAENWIYRVCCLVFGCQVIVTQSAKMMMSRQLIVRTSRLIVTSLLLVLFCFFHPAIPTFLIFWMNKRPLFIDKFLPSSSSFKNHPL